MKISLVLLTLVAHLLYTGRTEESIEYPPYDGFFNNLAHPDWGAAETQLFRRVPPVYGDGTYEPSGDDRPNPFNISDAVMDGPTGRPSFMSRTALLVFFGQQVVEEVLDAQRPGCPPEYFNIKIPKGHRLYDKENEGGKEMPLLRSRYDMRTGLNPNNPRQQINEISSFMDGTLIYGPNKAWTDALRSFEDGLLAATNDTNEDPDYQGYFPALNKIRLPYANPPPPRIHKLRRVDRFFKIGNPRGNENPFLLAFGVLWFRFHNLKARQIKIAHPNYNDEEIFNEARKWTIAVHQKIVMYDWLPAWTSAMLPPYTNYDPTIHPGIAHVFQSAAMRFGHTLVPPGVFRRDAQCNFRNTTSLTGVGGKHGLRTCNVYWTGKEVLEETMDIEELLMGMASQITEREDNIITPDLRGFVFGALEFSRRDLMAINIQRARDHGLPDYNTVREHYGLPRRTTFEEINPASSAAAVIANLSSVYNDDIDNVDLWPAGLLETTADGPGPTFSAIILDQFRRIRDGDRFWFENRQNRLFTDDEITEIRSYTLRDVILQTTNIPEDAIQANPFFFDADTDPCPQPFQLSHMNRSALAECTDPKTFDYFTGSSVSYILSFLAVGIYIVAMVFALIALAKWNQHSLQKQRATTRAKSVKGGRRNADVTPASEWVGRKEGERDVLLNLDMKKHFIVIQTDKGKPLRTIDLNVLMKTAETEMVTTAVSMDKGGRLVRFRIPKEYDLVLRFSESTSRDNFIHDLHTFFKSQNIRVAEATPMSEKQIFGTAKTKSSRQKLLERFFRVTFAYAFKYEAPDELRRLKVDGKEMHDIITCELTKYEFAEALSLKANSAFVENMFQLVDRDQDGYLSFREFLDVIIVFSKGTGEDKARLLFDMYDLDHSGSLDKVEFKLMLKSLMELANETIDEDQMTELLEAMMKSKGLANKKAITFEDFNQILREYQTEFNYASLSFEGISDSTIDTKPKKRENVPTRARHTFHRAYRSELDEDKNNRRSFAQISVQEKQSNVATGVVETSLNQFVNYMENHRLEIFWVVLYTLVLVGVFAERAYYYSVEREHAGLRRIAGYGVTVTRGAASAMMFTYSSLLVTMCRNTITFLRETFLRQYIPFDSSIAMHKYIAFLALLSTIIHITGHGINFYHISTQTANDLTCLFRNFFHATHELPKFHYWAWNTLTGFTGILLTLQAATVYIFATEYSRRNAFRAFWLTHNTYPIFFILMILHGAGRLVQPPFFHYFFLGPVVLFTLDKLVSISRKKIEIAVVKAELLPSDVTYIEFKRPQNFEYKSGQWVRIASLVQSKSEYHPFTLTSAPHEENLSLHIRAVGPWTMNLRRTYDPNSLRENALPKIYLDGPYGEGHQDWHKYDVSVLVGGGIGVTPFAAILKDLVHRSKLGGRIVCQKVYFLWITRTQKQFEWMTDIIRQVEENDSKNLVSVHIFITQFREKFDLRTTMLYICERHFQKISNRSLFTGLRSITHFGRPDFQSFFQSLLVEHAKTNVFGVFSCGPPPMTSGVEQACTEVNKISQNGLFVHHFENF